MARAKIIELECLRGFAACYVFVGHLLLVIIGVENHAARLVLQFGQEAVIIFFLLSGFVIHYSLRPETTWRSYLMQRFRRIYPLFLVALGATYVCACIQAGGLRDIRASEFVGNLFMLQDCSFLKPGTWFDPYYHNQPLWSLSYEWWFYMLYYPIERFVAAHRRVMAVIALSTLGFFFNIVYPNQIALFLEYYLIWWTGVETARAFLAGVEIGPAVAKPVCAMVVLTFGLMARAWYAHAIDREPLQIGADPLLPIRHFGAAVAIVAIGLLWSRYDYAYFKALFLPFSHASAISYAMYIIHMPIMATGMFAKIPKVAAGFAYMVVVVAVSYLLEVHVQRFANRLLKQSTGDGPGKRSPPLRETAERREQVTSDQR